MKSRVSVIIPNYNHARFLEQRIRSVLDQTIKPKEIIILDDCSSDSSVEIINKYQIDNDLITFYYNKENSGSPFIQWNKGVQLSKAEFIWIAESDDAADPKFLETLLQPLIKDKKVAISYCQSYKLNQDGECTGNWENWTKDFPLAGVFKQDFTMEGLSYIKQFLIHKNTIPNASAVVFRKEVFRNAGEADESVKNCSDWLTWLKMLLNSEISYIARPLNYFRYHPESTIAKAHLPTINYRPEFDYEMRKAFARYLDSQNGRDIKTIQHINDSYIYHSIGNSGLFNFRNGEYLKGITQILKATVYPKPTMSFLKRLFFN